MEVRKVHARGNSAAIAIPTPYLNRLRWGVGDYVPLEVADDTLVLRSVARRGSRVDMAPVRKGRPGETAIAE